jgi:1-acyl-sn-glycerol-3-phosphate acyltransferase
MTDEIMYELMLLSGQEYVDMYATKAKSLSADAALLADATEQVGSGVATASAA